MRLALKCFTFLGLLALPLFFGLFFGLNYPEIIRSGWPLTRCTVLDSAIDSRYCCETSCDKNRCSSAPSGAAQCSSQISLIDSQFSPTACAANSTACPTASGSTCDGGYYCCSTCCSTCTSCSTSCSGSPPTCSESCTSYSCNCYCCSDTNHLSCQLSCPVCYTVNVDVSYKTRSSDIVATRYTQDFKKDIEAAETFFNAHITNSTSFCYYNTKNGSQVLFDVSFTKWKWAVTAIFGFFPVAIALVGFAYLFIISPCFNEVKRGHGNARRWLAQRSEARSSRQGDADPPPSYTLKDGVAAASNSAGAEKP